MKINESQLRKLIRKAIMNEMYAGFAHNPPYRREEDPIEPELYGDEFPNDKYPIEIEEYWRNNHTKNPIDEAVRKTLTRVIREGKYTGEFDDTGNPIDAESYINSYEYIIDSLDNGNRFQAKEHFDAVDDKKDFLEWVKSEYPESFTYYIERLFV